MKIHHLKTYFPLKVRIFQGHVSFQRCSPNGKTPRKQASMHYSSPQNRPNVSQSLDCVFGGFRMSNKNCTSYFLDANRKNITKKKTYYQRRSHHWMILFLLFWLGASSQVPVAWNFSYLLRSIFFCWDWWVFPKTPPKRNPQIFFPWNLTFKGQRCTCNPGWEDCQVSKLGWKWWDVLLNGCVFSVFVGIFLVFFSFHPWWFLVFFFVSVFFVGVLRFSNGRSRSLFCWLSFIFSFGRVFIYFKS